MTAAARATPRCLRAALMVPRHRRTGLITAVVVLVAYLFSIGDLAVSASGRFTGVPMFQTAWERVFQARAPYLFEPVVAVHPSAHRAVFVSPLNLLLGGIVAALVGCNIAVAGLAARQRRPAGRPVGESGGDTHGFMGCSRQSCSASPAAHRPSCSSSVPAPPPRCCRC